MNNNSGIMGGLYQIAEWVMKFSVINLLWIAFNLPIAFLLLNLVFVEQFEALFLFLIPIIILMPFLLFPATTAVFGVVRDWIMKGEEDHPLFKSYWRYYKENYKRSMANGFVLVGIWIILVADIYYFYEKSMLMMGIFAVMGIILIVFSINLFSMTVHYRMSFWKTMKSNFFVTVGSPTLFLAIALSSGLVVYLSLHVVRYLLPLLTVSLIAFLSFSAFYRNYLKTIEKTK